MLSKGRELVILLVRRPKVAVLREVSRTLSQRCGAARASIGQTVTSLGCWVLRRGCAHLGRLPRVASPHKVRVTQPTAA